MRQADLAELPVFMASPEATALKVDLKLVGLLRNATATHVDFSGDNFESWQRLPMSLLKETTHLGSMVS